jgi:hypothetical protein
MANNLVVILDGEESQFGLQMVDRAKLYGKRKRLNLDPSGAACTRAELTDDGQFLVRSGMTSQGYFDEKLHWIPRGDLVGINSRGETVEKVSSTLGVAQKLIGPIAPEAVFDLEVETVYYLTPEAISGKLAAALDRGEVYRCVFNYRADYHAEQALLLKNSEGVFAIVGSPASSVWCELQQFASDIDTEEDAISDDLDFDMF